MTNTLGPDTLGIPRICKLFLNYDYIKRNANECFSNLSATKTISTSNCNKSYF